MFISYIKHDGNKQITSSHVYVHTIYLIILVQTNLDQDS